MRKAIGCLVLLVASPAFGYLVDIPGNVYLDFLGPPDFRSFTIEMYIDTESTMITATSAESRIATVDSSGNPVPDILDIVGPAAIPITNKSGTITDYTYPQYNAPIWKQKQSELALPLPQGRCNAGAGQNWSNGRVGSVVNQYNGYSYIYGRVKMATFRVQLKDGYWAGWPDFEHPKFYVVAADAYAQHGTVVVNPGERLAVYDVGPEPATALLVLGAIPFLRRRRH